jgi:hypothetical protein
MSDVVKGLQDFCYRQFPLFVTCLSQIVQDHHLSFKLIQNWSLKSSGPTLDIAAGASGLFLQDMHSLHINL